MSAFERIAEEKIRRAMQEGQFDALPGMGKPLKLDEDALTPEDQRLAQHVLKNQGFLPDWLEAGREIEAERVALRRDFRREHALAGSLREREDLCAAFKRRISALNRKILGFNVRVPGRGFERPSLDPEFEMQAALAASADKE